MELHKKIRKGSTVSYKNYIDGKVFFRVVDIFKNTYGDTMICIVRFNTKNSIEHRRGMVWDNEYYDSKRFNILFKTSLVDILKEL